MILALMMPLSTSGDSFLHPLGPIADAERAHLVHVVLLTMIAAGPALLATPLILWRYRRRNTKAKYTPGWESNRILETLMWGVPVLVVLLMGFGIWRFAHQYDPYRQITNDPVRVEVIGLNWKWVFIYPDEGVATVDELIIPTGRSVSMRLTTDTVMQSFRVSALAGQIYAMPGMVTELHLIADRTGETRGMNTQFSGIDFWQQKFVVRAVTPEQFEQTMNETRASGPTLNDKQYALIAEQGTAKNARTALGLAQDAPLRFSLVDAALFDRVLARYHTDAPISHSDQPGSPSYNPATATLPPPINTMKKPSDD